MWWRDYAQECAAWLVTLPRAMREIIGGGDRIDVRLVSWVPPPPIDAVELAWREAYLRACKYGEPDTGVFPI